MKQTIKAKDVMTSAYAQLDGMQTVREALTAMKEKKYPSRDREQTRPT